MTRQSDREARILSLLRQSHYAAVTDLARLFGVSEETIRRDLKRLEKAGVVEKVHGGVMLSEFIGEPPFRSRMELNHAAKVAIGRRAAEMTPEGATVFVDGGTTCCVAARFLRAVPDLTVVTCSIEVARLLIEGRTRVLLTPGQLDPDDFNLYGPDAADFIARFSYGWALLSASAIHPRLGCCDYKLEEATLKRRAAFRAERLMLLADASKFGQTGMAEFCALDAIDFLVTDAPPPIELTRLLRATIEVASPTPQQR